MHLGDAFHDMFTLGIPWSEKFFRTIAVYFFLLVALRLAGKRELGQVSTSDLIVILLLSNTVQNAIIGDETSLVGGLFGAAVLIIINKGVVGWTYRRERIRRLLDGGPIPLVINGQVQMHTLQSQRIAIEELAAAARDQNVKGVADINQAMLETNGTISIIPKETGGDTTIEAQLNRIETMLAELCRTPNGQGGAA